MGDFANSSIDSAEELVAFCTDWDDVSRCTLFGPILIYEKQGNRSLVFRPCYIETPDGIVRIDDGLWKDLTYQNITLHRKRKNHRKREKHGKSEEHGDWVRRELDAYSAYIETRDYAEDEIRTEKPWESSWEGIPWAAVKFHGIWKNDAKVGSKPWLNATNEPISLAYMELEEAEFHLEEAAARIGELKHLRSRYRAVADRLPKQCRAALDAISDMDGRDATPADQANSMYELLTLSLLIKHIVEMDGGSYTLGEIKPLEGYAEEFKKRFIETDRALSEKDKEWRAGKLDRETSRSRLFPFKRKDDRISIYYHPIVLPNSNRRNAVIESAKDGAGEYHGVLKATTRDRSKSESTYYIPDFIITVASKGHVRARAILDAKHSNLFYGIHNDDDLCISTQVGECTAKYILDCVEPHGEGGDAVLHHPEGLILFFKGSADEGRSDYELTIDCPAPITPKKGEPGRPSRSTVLGIVCDPDDEESASAAIATAMARIFG